MTCTRYTLHDVGRALSWGALSHFVQYLPRTSALSRDLQPMTDEELWASGNATAAILADIYDALNQLNTNVCNHWAGKSASRVTPYKRPWDHQTATRVLGNDPIPVQDFEDWWNSH